jgi:CheY-like chemotaxis protein
VKSHKTALKIKAVVQHNGQIKSPEGLLIVDDCELMRLVIRRALEQAGYRVWAAATGEEAIDLYWQHWSRIAAVLLDVQMPGLDGPQTLDALLELDPEVRACFVSGDTGDYTPADLIRRGAHGVLFRPFQVADLSEMAKRLIGGNLPVTLPREQNDLGCFGAFGVSGMEPLYAVAD